MLERGVDCNPVQTRVSFKHYITNITLHYITLHNITLHYITLHYITNITLHYISLHYKHYTNPCFIQMCRTTSEKPPPGRFLNLLDSD